MKAQTQYYSVFSSLTIKCNNDWKEIEICNKIKSYEQIFNAYTGWLIKDRQNFKL